MDEGEVEGRTVSNACKKGKVRTGLEERGAKGGKKTSVSTWRPGESSQNEVRPHEPYINQPRLFSSVLPSLKLALFIFTLTVPPFVPSLVDRRTRY